MIRPYIGLNARDRRKWSSPLTIISVDLPTCRAYFESDASAEKKRPGAR